MSSINVIMDPNIWGEMPIELIPYVLEFLPLKEIDRVILDLPSTCIPLKYINSYTFEYYTQDLLYNICVYKKRNGMKVIRNKTNKFFWECVSKNQHLTEIFLREFHNFITWPYVQTREKLSENFIRDFRKRLAWQHILKYQNISADFLYKLLRYKDIASNNGSNRYNNGYCHYYSGNNILYDVIEYAPKLLTMDLLCKIMNNDRLRSKFPWNKALRCWDLFPEEFFQSFQKHIEWETIRKSIIDLLPIHLLYLGTKNKVIWKNMPEDMLYQLKMYINWELVVINRRNLSKKFLHQIANDDYIYDKIRHLSLSEF